MSQWGKLDRLVIPGTVIANLDSRTVITSQDQSANIKVGYALVLGNVEYVVANAINGTTFTLDVPYEGANTVGEAGFVAVQQSPKTLRTYGWGANLILGANTVNARNVYGVDKIEAQNPDNKAKGINSPGWVHYKEWVNTQGTTRRRAETLVAMSKNFNYSNVDFNVNIDANDDDVVPDYSIGITAGPTATKIANANSVTAIYSVTAVTTPSGGTPTYTWQFSPNNIVWVSLVNNDGPLNTGNTTSAISLANVYATPNVVGGYVRVVVGVSAGATETVTSDAIQITTA